MRKTIFVLILLLGPLFSLKAQSFDASQWTQGVTTITAPWRFHPGDDPAWASPTFDDSNWPLLATNREWREQGYGSLRGYAWYRMRLKLPATTQPLAFDTGRIITVGELYVDGKLVGTNGIMRPKPEWSNHRTVDAFQLPASSNGRWVVVAIRVWKSPIDTRNASGGLLRPPVVGSLPLLLKADRVAFDNAAVYHLPSGIVYLLTLVLGCFSLGLFLLDRRSTEYAWFALWAIGVAVIFSIREAVVLRQGSVTFSEGDLVMLNAPLFAAEALFLWGFLKARRDWMFWVVVGLGVVGEFVYGSAFHGFVPLATGSATRTLAEPLAFALIAARILSSLRAGSRDARLLLLPIVLRGIGLGIQDARQGMYLAGRSHGDSLPPLFLWSNGIIGVSWSNVFDALFLIAIAAALILRFTRSAREEKRLATELDSARAVQDRLVPAQLPTLPGLQLGAVYLPAAEVGGDFYQVFPQRDESALVVVGDVSGKGLRAAMTGTLVLGGLQSLAQENLSPAQVLARLNDQLVSSTDGGFVTCLCARVASDGSLTVANAGHLAPYRNGEECEVESGLPLGIVVGAQYEESTVQLEAGDTLTLMSDGVVEAQGADGELFGFERTQAISDQSAEEIAAAAQRFGQKDDISVLTIAFAPAAVLQM